MSGLGEKFAADLHTGTGNMTVPLALPPGRNGLQPSLTLSYSTAQGQGPMGLGWSLGFPSLSRQTLHGLPRYRDRASDPSERDTFMLSGFEDLVAVDERDPERVRYRPRTEGLFARITRHTRPALGIDFWEVSTKDGSINTYGHDPLDPTHGAAPPVSANTYRPDDPLAIFSWGLTVTRDPFGNRIEYLYDRHRPDDLDAARGHRSDLPLLKRIQYADAGGPEAPTFMVRVDFDYEARPDAYSTYRSGFEQRISVRCSAIRVYTALSQERHVKTYRFRYREDPKTRASLLAAVEIYGVDADGSDIRTVPPLEFDYSRFEPERRDGRRFFPLRGPDLPATSLADPTLELVDLHGHGLPDVLELGRGARYYKNLGNGQFDRPRPLRSVPDGVVLGSPGVRMLDADGDGRMDLMLTGEPLAGHFRLAFGPRWDPRSFKRHAVAPSFAAGDPEVRFFDLTGDGVTDALRTGTRLECYFNHPERGWDSSRLVERRPLELFPNVLFSDARVHTADMTGDGLTDIVFVHDGSVSYWPNLGYGTFGRCVEMHDAPRLPEDYDPKRLLIGDITGDGAADLVYVDDGRVIVYLNRQGNGFAAPIVIEGTPRVGSADSMRLTDLLGSGVSGVLFSADAAAPGRSHYYFLDLTGGTKPYLLVSSENHLGSKTLIEYESSTVDAIDDAKRGAEWKTPLPFPVQVVRRVRATDAFTGGTLTARYRYHDGYWDGSEREFRGFGCVEEFDAETFAAPPGAAEAIQHAPPVLTRQWFHQGAIEDEFGDLVDTSATVEAWLGDGGLLAASQFVSELERALDARLAALGLTSRQRFRARRDARRSLRGRLLRREVYALDGSDRERRPYTVTEGLFGFREEAGAGAPNDRQRVFFSFPLAERTTEWERGDDPLTRFDFSDDYDAFGQARRRTSIACPRGWRRLDDRPSQPYLATRTLATYAAPTSPDNYLYDRVARSDAFELTGNAGMQLFELRDLADDDASLIRTAQTLTFYDGEAFQGLPLGKVGAFGARVRVETLVLTPEIVAAAYGAAAPSYLTDEQPNWPPEYPTGAAGIPTFRASVPPLAGYLRHQAGDASLPGVATGWFAAESHAFDFQLPASGRRGLVRRSRDAHGSETTFGYRYELLLAEVTDATGQLTTTEYDERFLTPVSITDPNGNQLCFAYGAHALVTAAFRRGKTRSEGDWEQPGTAFVYDFFAFSERGQPISVRTLRRVHHDSDTDVPLAERDEVVESREYSDGFGRLLQSRAPGEEVRFGGERLGGNVVPLEHGATDEPRLTGRRAADPDRPNVIVSGFEIRDNKGRLVRKYEPFFAEGWDYTPPAELPYGEKVDFYFDAVGALVRTLHADGSEQRVVHGVPEAGASLELRDPERFLPTPWEAYTYTQNDNAGRTHGAAALPYAHAWDTPESIVIDALGRTIEQVRRNRRPGAAGASVEELVTRQRFDIRGSLLSLEDPLRRTAFRYVYDLAQQPLRSISLDGGEAFVVRSAAGLEIERRDQTGTLTLHAYDALRRPTRLWARDAPNESVGLRAVLSYGDEIADAAEAASRNVRGRLVSQLDGAGRQTTPRYDFKGNCLEREREVVTDAELEAQANATTGGAGGFRVDWDQPPALDLPLSTAFRYDALDRVVETLLPEDSDGERKRLVPRFHASGAVAGVSMGGEVYVRHIAYDAKGARVFIAYGNGVLTRFGYNPRTFRLARLRSERYVASGTGPGELLTFEATGGVLQDEVYAYDLEGNVVAIRARAPGSGVLDGPLGRDALDRTFVYDAVSRLLSATGREALYAWPPVGTAAAVLDRSPFATGQGFRATSTPDVAPTQTAAYTETYEYDPAGNLTRLRHQQGASSWARRFGHSGLDPVAWEQAWTAQVAAATPWVNPPTNRVTHVSDSSSVFPQTHEYDANGNLLRENGTRHFSWDHAGKLKSFAVRSTANGAASVEALYLYDLAGTRVKKWVRRAGGPITSTVYASSEFERHREDDRVNDTLRVSDGKHPVATRRAGLPFPDDAAPELAVRFVLTGLEQNHELVLGVTTTGAVELVSREEFYPFGETSYGGHALKRYRHTGVERDDESGLDYHFARYYAPWCARFVSADPIGLSGGVNAYTYAANNPLTFKDPGGTQETPTQDSAANNAAAWQEATKEAGAAAVETRKAADKAVKATGISTVYGTTSDYAKLSDKQKQRFVAKHTKKGTSPPKPEPTNCIMYGQGALEDGLLRFLDRTEPGVRNLGDRIDQVLTFSEVYADSAGAPPHAVPSGRGTAVARYLHDEYQWKTTLITTNKQSDQVGPASLGKALPFELKGKAAFVKGAVTGLPVDVTTPIDNIMAPGGTNFSKKATVAHEKLDMKALSKIPFAFGVVYSDSTNGGWGYHTFLVVDGKVLDAHWSTEPTETGAFGSQSLENLMKTYDNVILVTPPTAPPASSSPLMAPLH